MTLWLLPVAVRDAIMRQLVARTVYRGDPIPECESGTLPPDPDGDDWDDDDGEVEDEPCRRRPA
jgi:hypothetical protein